MSKANRRRQTPTPRPSDRGSLRGLFRRSPKKAPVPRKQVGVGYLVLLALVVTLVAGAFIFHLHIRFEGARLSHEGTAARSVKEQLLRERDKLQLELASLKAPHRVEAEARERLGMAVPDHRRIIPVAKRAARVPVSGGAL